MSDSFIAGHIPILVIVTGWLFGRNPHLWRQAQDLDAERTDQHQAAHKVRHHARGVDSRPFRRPTGPLAAVATGPLGLWGETWRFSSWASAAISCPSRIPPQCLTSGMMTSNFTQ